MTDRTVKAILMATMITVWALPIGAVAGLVYWFAYVMTH